MFEAACKLGRLEATHRVVQVGAVQKLDQGAESEVRGISADQRRDGPISKNPGQDRVQNHPIRSAADLSASFASRAGLQARSR
jgi:hypothetical protein